METNITGYYGCSCHPFKNWVECDFYHKQKFNEGDKVKHRCQGFQSVISNVIGKGFYYIIGENGLVLEHAANLIKQI